MNSKYVALVIVLLVASVTIYFISRAKLVTTPSIPISLPVPPISPPLPVPIPIVGPDMPVPNHRPTPIPGPNPRPVPNPGPVPNTLEEVMNLFKLLNTKRSPLVMDPILQKMAQEFADDQYVNKYRLRFTDSKNRNFTQRAKDNNYTFTKVQEMEWYFPGNVESVVNGILQQNPALTDSSLKRIGIGYRPALLPIWVIEMTD